MSRAAAKTEKTPQPAAAQAPVEVPEDAMRAHRANQVFSQCKGTIVSRYPPLWPGEAQGAAIADAWLRELEARLRAQMQGQMEARQIEVAR